MFPNNVNGHIKHINKLLTTLKDHGGTLKIMNPTFFQQKVEYFGQIVKPGFLEVGITNVGSLPNAELLKYKKIRSFE